MYSFKIVIQKQSDNPAHLSARNPQIKTLVFEVDSSESAFIIAQAIEQQVNSYLGLLTSEKEYWETK